MPKKKTTKPAVVSLSWAKLTVAEVLIYSGVDKELCDEMAKYYRYGTDKAKALAVMEKVPGHKSALEDALSCGEGIRPPLALVAPLLAYLDAPMMTAEDLAEEMAGHFEWKGAKDGSLLAQLRAKVVANLPADMKLGD